MPQNLPCLSLDMRYGVFMLSLRNKLVFLSSYSVIPSKTFTADALSRAFQQLTVVEFQVSYWEQIDWMAEYDMKNAFVSSDNFYHANGIA